MTPAAPTIRTPTQPTMTQIIVVVLVPGELDTKRDGDGGGGESDGVKDGGGGGGDGGGGDGDSGGGDGGATMWT